MSAYATLLVFFSVGDAQTLSNEAVDEAILVILRTTTAAFPGLTEPHRHIYGPRKGRVGIPTGEFLVCVICDCMPHIRKPN